jgi:hypothetical protein
LIEVLNNNNRAYEDEILGYKNKGGVYNFTIDQIKTSLDSTVLRLNEVRQELGIKDRQLQEMGAVRVGLKESVEIDVYMDRDSSFDAGYCDFNIKYEFNEWTKLDLELVSGKLQAGIDIRDNYYLFIYSRKEWKEPKFVRRLVKFKWGKYDLDKFELKNDNELNKIEEVKVVRVKS